MGKDKGMYKAKKGTRIEERGTRFEILPNDRLIGDF